MLKLEEHPEIFPLIGFWMQSEACKRAIVTYLQVLYCSDGGYCHESNHDGRK